MRYFNGNRYEIAVCRDCVDQDDLNASLSLIPQPIRLVGYEVDTETLCCGPEITYMYWETNAEATMKALSFTP
jgi:hypothetical protein